MDKKEMFERYERVRQSGIFNMITQASDAMRVADLTKEQYFYVINNYGKLKVKYGKE